MGSPAVSAGRAVVGSSDARFVHAVDLATGRELWRMRADGNTLSSPAIAGDTVVVGEGGGALLALDLGSGRELWRVPTGDVVHSSPLLHEGVVYVGSDDGKVYALAGDLAAPARRAWRTVYFDARAPLRLFQGDRHLREALAAEGYSVLTRRDLGPFLEARIADREPSVVVFATDNVPTPIVDDAAGPALVRRYLDSGGRIVWPGTTPFLYTFDPDTLALVDFDPAHVQRHERLLGVANDNAFVGECRAQATPARRRLGPPRRLVALRSAGHGAAGRRAPGLRRARQRRGLGEALPGRRQLRALLGAHAAAQRPVGRGEARGARAAVSDRLGVVGIRGTSLARW